MDVQRVSSDVLNKLFSARQAIESEKTSERKKASSSLQELLRRSEVIDFIDGHSRCTKSSAGKGTRSRGQVITWGALFRNVSGYIAKEIESILKLEKKGSCSSATALSNRVTKKKDVAEMFRAYVRACNKNLRCLPVTEVLDHMKYMMEDTSTKDWAAMDYTHILLGHILSVPQYVLTIQAERWESLLTLYCDMYFSSIASLDKTLVAKVIQTLLSHSSTQVDIPLHGLYIFYSKAFSKISEEKNLKLLEELLGGLCKYSMVAGANGKSRLCSLGEDILSSILLLWSRGVPSLKDQIVEFLRIQIRVHHPGGRISEDEGAWYRDDLVWKENVKKLYQMIMSELESSSSRLRRLSDWSLSEGVVGHSFEFCDLACDLVYIMMHMKDEESESMVDSHPRAKKRRAPSCWTTLCDGLSSSKGLPSTISWLQLIGWLLSKRRKSLPTQEFLPLLSVLQSMLRERESKRAACTNWVILSLCSLALNSTTAKYTPDPQAKDLWRKIWHSTIKLLTVHCAEPEGYTLLTIILDLKLIQPDLGIWQLLKATFNSPSHSTVSFLACFLGNHPLPEYIGPPGSALMAPTAAPFTQTQQSSVEYLAVSSYPLRTQLLNFLVPVIVLEDSMRGVGMAVGGVPGSCDLGKYPIKTSNLGMRTSLPSVALLSHVLVALTQRSHGSARLSFLRHFYHHANPSFIRVLLDPSFSQTHQTSFISDPFSSSSSSHRTRRDFISEWGHVERVFLQSTFDEPLDASCLHTKTQEENKEKFSSEVTIGSLQGLLLQLLGKRSEMLLQPLENLMSSRDQSQQLERLLELQAHHCCLILHTILLLCQCEAFTQLDQLRRTLAIRTLPKLLKSIESSLRDPVWYEIERVYYHQISSRLLSTLLPLLSFPHFLGPLPPHAAKALLVMRKVCAHSLPESLLELVLELARGKWPVPQPMLSTGSTFGLESSSSSTLRQRKESRSVSVDFDDDMVLPDSGPSDHSDFSGSTCIGPHDLLSISSLNDKSACQLKASIFFCHVYISWSCIPTNDSDGGGVGVGGMELGNGEGSTFDVKKALHSLLSEQEKSKSVNIQIAFKIVQNLSEHENAFSLDLLECAVDVINDILSIHRMNQTVYCEALALLCQLLPHFNKADTSLIEIRNSYMTMVSGFWTLYNDKILPAAVRLKLIDLLSALHNADRDNTWSCLVQVLRRKKGESQDKKGESQDKKTSVKQALLLMINDPHHAVRMHMATVITSLFVVEVNRGSPQLNSRAEGPSDSTSCDNTMLLSRKDQEDNFQEVLEKLDQSDIVVDSVQDLSAEDEYVSRVASQIFTLLMVACVSPVCERKAVTKLVNAVGHNAIDSDLVGKALKQLSLCLGYTSTQSLLETMLPSLAQEWQKEGFLLAEFPFKLMEWNSSYDFFKAYSNQLVPHLVFKGDEDTLTTLSQILDTSISSLLKASLPTSMVLILTCWAQGEEGEEGKGEEIRRLATASHNFLLKHISEEAIAQTLQLSMNKFVIELLVRMFEPENCMTHLARFCVASDPEPGPPHYTSHMVRATLDYMPTCYGSSSAGTSFLHLLSKRSEFIQDILLSLAVKIETTHRFFEKRRFLLAYNLFVQLVSKEIQDEGLQGMRSFVTMDVIHTIVRILSKGDTGSRVTSMAMAELFPLCVDVLDSLSMAVLRTCPEVLEPHLHTIVTTLMPHARRISSNNGKQAFSLLCNLLDKVSLKIIAQLDPFPESEPFTCLHQKQAQSCQDLGGISLSEKTDRFLCGGNKSLYSVRTEGLKSLQKSLHSATYEISHLLNGDSSGPLLRLLRGLVDLCLVSSLPSVTTTHVANVLAEIGPRDLKCIALPASKEGAFDSDSLPTTWNPKLVSSVKLLYLLSMLLFDKDISVVEASGECLRKVLTSRTGSLVLDKLEEEVGVDSLQWYHYLQPFRPQRRKKSSTVPAGLPLNTTSFVTLVDNPDLWIPVYGGGRASHSKWLTKLVITLMTSGGVSDEMLTLIKPVCTVQVELCEEVFPLIIHDILLAMDTNFHSILSKQVKKFFHTVSSISRPSSPILSQPASHGHDVHPDSIRTMLNMVMYLRTVEKPQSSQSGIPSTPWDNNFWLDLDFLDVAKAAQRCAAYFTSLLYIEIWRGAAAGKHFPRGGHTPEDSLDLDDIDEAMLIEPEYINPCGSQDEASDVQSLLLEAYRHIGEPDSLYGVCSTHVTDDRTRLLLYEHEGEWHKSLSTHNILMELPGASSQRHVAESLHQLGLSHILKMYLCSVRSTKAENIGGDEEMGEYLYETAWRSTQWEEEDSQNVSTGLLGTVQGGYHQCLFNCITSLKDREINSLQNYLNEARCHVIRSMCSTGLESTYGLYPSLSKFLCLLEIEEASSGCGITSDHVHYINDISFLKDWQERLPHLNSDFQFVEPVLAVRGSVLHCLLQVSAGEMSCEGASVPVEQRRMVEGVFEALRETLLTHSRLAREATNYQVCERALFSLKQLYSKRERLGVPSSLYSSLPSTLKFEEAKLFWERGEWASAMALLSQLLNKFKLHHQTDPVVSTLYSTSLSLYGSWLAETRSESPSEIITKYLERSVELMEAEHHVGEKNSVMESYLTLARYADNQYRRIERHLESSAFEAKRQHLQKTKSDLQKLESKMPLEERQRNRHVRTLQTQSEEDESVLSNLQEEKQLFLQKSLKNYIRCLQSGDMHDLRIFRLCGLWFANSNDAAINEIMKEGISRLESWKFIPLMYQLAARMSLASDSFQKVLQEVIHRSVLEHPYHCLYIILALSNASKDNQFPTKGYVTGSKKLTPVTSRLSRRSAVASSVDEDKVKAARCMIDKLRSQKPSLITSMEQLCEAYIDLAYFDVSPYKSQRGAIKLPASCPLLKLNKQPIVIPTIDLAVDRTCSYANVVCINRFEKYFQLVGGVNLPKVMTCIGSDGRRRKQLVKGRDDLRQDAVMQQIFVLVNRLLISEPATRKRKLCVRTYKVIPLSQRSGVVEWCESTRPLGEYLVGSPNHSNSAHSRYRPMDWTALECRKKMTGVARGASKLAVFSEITKRFSPVFHHFFMEYFPTPPQWFERCLAYTRSVAASSMVGYMVGLGDRHVQNILIDTNTAEFIHIDLGVAFEQGKTLPTPETVPFRLTKDIVDGMGIAGVEGVFRRCCEKTLSLMRAHQEELRTIVEVLLHDPLYQWTLSPLKALNLQHHHHHRDHGEDISTNPGDIFETTAPTTKLNSDLNKMAERVLIRLQEKLEGIEDGVPLSVSGQVNHLIQEATDPSNLCMLFPGWQPWI